MFEVFVLWLSDAAGTILVVLYDIPSCVCADLNFSCEKGWNFSLKLMMLLHTHHLYSSLIKVWKVFKEWT